jgi:hypothetical protein
MQTGFFRSLFDISFSSLITTKVIKFLYVISLIVIGLAALFFIVAAFTRSPGSGVVTLVIIAPLFSLLYVVYTRVILEFIIVVFRISEYNREMVELMRVQVAGAGAFPVAAPGSTPPGGQGQTPPPPVEPTP